MFKGLGKKHKSEMPAPQPKKKRKAFKKQIPKGVSPITDFFNRSFHPKHDDEQKLDSAGQPDGTDMRIEIESTSDVDEPPGIKLSQFSQLSQLSFCGESEDADCSQSESDWLKKRRTAPVIPTADRSWSETSRHSIGKTSSLMRTLSLESSQGYFTPSDQPIIKPTSEEMKNNLFQNRGPRFTALPCNDSAQAPLSCHINHFLPPLQQETQREINLEGRGKFFKEYKQEGKVGKGSFGEVYKCRHRFDGCVYAVKTVKQNTHHSSMEMIRREARMCAAVRALLQDRGCPNLVQYYQSWEEDGNVHIAMEFCSEGTLASQLGKRMPDNVLIQIFEEIGSALEGLHSVNIVHLDVKPSNILVTANHVFKLSDFGTAVKVDAEDELNEGDRRYMSNELMEGSFHKSQLDKTDIFSLGASVYEMYLGTPLPDNGMDWIRLRQEIAFDNPLGQSAKELIQATMRSDCDCRPKAAELVRAIREQKARPNC